MTLTSCLAEEEDSFNFIELIYYAKYKCYFAINQEQDGSLALYKINENMHFYRFKIDIGDKLPGNKLSKDPFEDFLCIFTVNLRF